MPHQRSRGGVGMREGTALSVLRRIYSIFMCC